MYFFYAFCFKRSASSTSTTRIGTRKITSRFILCDPVVSCVLKMNSSMWYTLSNLSVSVFYGDENDNNNNGKRRPWHISGGCLKNIKYMSRVLLFIYEFFNFSDMTVCTLVNMHASDDVYCLSICLTFDCLVRTVFVFHPCVSSNSSINNSNIDMR